MKKKDETLYYIVNQNGEILREIGQDSVRLVNNDIYIMRDSPEGNDPTAKVKYSYLKKNKAVGEVLYNECPQFLLLEDYINFKENALRYSNGEYITPTNFARHLGYSEIYMTRLFNKMRKLKIIAKLRKDNRYIYVVNPYIAMRGAEVRKSTLELFRKTEWEMLGKRKGKLNGSEERDK